MIADLVTGGLVSTRVYVETFAEGKIVAKICGRPLRCSRMRHDAPGCDAIRKHA